MSLDAGLDCRPIDPSQVRAYADLLTVIMIADDDSQVMSEDEILDDFGDPLIDFERGSLACYDGDEMIGYTIVTRGGTAESVHDLHQWGGVDPRYRGRGIGSGLVRWAEEVAVRLHLEHFPDRPASMGCYVLSKNTQAVELFVASGYERSRWFHEMTRDLSAEIPARELPDDVEVLGFAPERSADALLVMNESFRDHWGSADISPESWEFRTGTRAFRPALSFLAYSDGEPIGLVMADDNEGQYEKTGTRDVHIPRVGTRRAARRRGIATGLLTIALRAAAAQGYDTATLFVDADSPTGAVGIYDRLGFVTKDTRVTVTKRLYEPEPAPEPAPEPEPEPRAAGWPAG